MTHIKLYTTEIEGTWKYLVMIDDHMHYEPTFESLVEHLRKLMTLPPKERIVVDFQGDVSTEEAENYVASLPDCWAVYKYIYDKYGKDEQELLDNFRHNQRGSCPNCGIYGFMREWKDAGEEYGLVCPSCYDTLPRTMREDLDKMREEDTT